MKVEAPMRQQLRFFVIQHTMADAGLKAGRRKGNNLDSSIKG